MGDRGNVVVKDYFGDKASDVYLYSHWGGTELPQTLAEALDSPQGRARWDDPSYLARIIFCRMVRGDEDGETGFGITAGSPPDNEHPLLVVDTKSGTVNGVSFEAFIASHKVAQA